MFTELNLKQQYFIISIYRFTRSFNTVPTSKKKKPKKLLINYCYLHGLLCLYHLMFRDGFAKSLILCAHLRTLMQISADDKKGDG